MRASISLAIAGLVWFSTYLSAQPNKEVYELQERCGKRAAEVFRREHNPPISKTKDGQTLFNYEGHYSARLNKCFFLEVAVSYERKEGKPTISKTMRLFELNDNKQYGIYMSGFVMDGPPIGCEVQDIVCQSENEWRQLLKPFMED